MSSGTVTEENYVAWETAYRMRPRVKDLPPSIRAGMLLKKATITGRWQERWFVLPEESEFLYYFEDGRPETPLKGLICLGKGTTIAFDGPEGKYDFMFTIGMDLPRRPTSSEPTSTFTIRSNHKEDYKAWVHAISDTPVEYTDPYGRILACDPACLFSDGDD